MSQIPRVEIELRGEQHEDDADEHASPRANQSYEDNSLSGNNALQQERDSQNRPGQNDASYSRRSARCNKMRALVENETRDQTENQMLEQRGDESQLDEISANNG
ncbi:MAG: hypothetical protein ACTIA6_11785 [Pseudoclavibacter sp.]